MKYLTLVILVALEYKYSDSFLMLIVYIYIFSIHLLSIYLLLHLSSLPFSAQFSALSRVSYILIPELSGAGTGPTA